MSYSASILHTPALRALALQAVSFFLTLLVVAGGEQAYGGEVPLLLWGILQGGLAAALSHWGGLASWWLVIQFFFPLALIAAHAIHLPPMLFLCFFLVFLVLYWTTFRTQVPFYPSTPATWGAVVELLPKGRSIRFVDIGSGFGGLILHLAASRPESVFIGVELAPLPWLVSMVRAWVTHSRGTFVRRDYHDLNLKEFDVVFAFLSPAAMPALWKKARQEMHGGSLLLSYEFPIPDVAPDIALPPDNRGAVLYGWQM